MLKDLCRLMTPEEVAYHVHISVKHKFIFVETPKVACSYIKKMLQRFELQDQTYEVDLHKVHDRAQSPLLNPWQVDDFDSFARSPDVVKFCFVRNPISRLLSGYLDKIVGNKEQKPAILDRLYPNASLEHPVSFPEFVNVVSSTNIFELDPHWRPQYLLTFCGIINYDFVGRFERLNRDVATLDRMFSGRLKPYISNIESNRTRADARVQEYYDHNTLAVANKIYEIDAKLFGYRACFKNSVMDTVRRRAINLAGILLPSR